LYSRKHVAYWHGSTLKSQLQTSVAKLLKFEVMKDAVTRGFDWFDFNPSAGLPGVKFFKEGFNAVAMPAPVVYVDTALKRLARTCAVSVQLDYARLSLEPLQNLMHSRSMPEA
jgi:lipid II:glycine glycyltransferase (peptidoglycan interpeptide bridge formation enzyme)